MKPEAHTARAMAPCFSDVMKAEGCVLAFDTAEDYGTVVVAKLVESGPIQWLAERRIDEPRQQSARLALTIAEALESSGVRIDALAGVVVGAGPGSFTGVRVAAATAKGIVFGSQTPLWTPSSLLGAALDPRWGEEALRCVAFDARGDRVYAAAYEVSPGTPPRVIHPPSATTIQDVVRLAGQGGWLLGGSALRRHHGFAREAGVRTLEGPIGEPSAKGLIRALMLDPTRRASEDPSQFEPSYLRGSSAVPLAKAPEEVP